MSGDSVKSHVKFRDAHRLNFPLLADESKAMMQAYGVWKEKSLYGRTFLGIERSTFVIDAEGRIAHVFRKVSVDGHFDEVIAALDAR